MTWYEPSDGGILDALECDLAQWHAAAAQRDITDLRRISDRIAQRRAEVDHYLRDEIKYVKADADLARVERVLAPPPPVREPAPVLLPPWDDETHLQRWGPTYLGVAAATVITVLVVWLVIELVAALTALLAALIPVLMVVAIVILLLGWLGSWGGRGFSGTFSGKMH